MSYSCASCILDCPSTCKMINCRMYTQLKHTSHLFKARFSSKAGSCFLTVHVASLIRPRKVTINFDVQLVSCRVFSFSFQGGTSQPVGDKGDSGAKVINTINTSKDPPSQPPPTWTRTSEIYSGSVCGREASCEVMEMTLGIQLNAQTTDWSWNCLYIL